MTSLVHFGMRVAVVAAANSAVDVALKYKKGAQEVTRL